MNYKVFGSVISAVLIMTTSSAMADGASMLKVLSALSQKSWSLADSGTDGVHVGNGVKSKVTAATLQVIQQGENPVFNLLLFRRWENANGQTPSLGAQLQLAVGGDDLNVSDLNGVPIRESSALTSTDSTLSFSYMVPGYLNDIQGVYTVTISLLGNGDVSVNLSKAGGNYKTTDSFELQ